MLRIAIIAFALAFTALAADPEVTFVQKQNRVSVRELQVSQKAKDKYADAEGRLRRHDTEGARRRLREALAIAPEYSAAWNALGAIAADTASAESNFRRAVEADPDNFDAVLNLGGVLLKTGRPEEALPFNQRAATVLSGDAAAQVQLGMNLYQLGQIDEAEPRLLAAKKLDPGIDSMPQLFLAEIYSRRGEKDRAAAEIEELLARKLDKGLATTLRGVLARLRQTGIEYTLMPAQNVAP